MSPLVAQPAYDMDGAFNDLTATLLRSASEAEVLRRIDLLTERYGGVGAYGRYDQTSHRYLTDEIKGLRGMGMVAPAIFLSSTFALSVAAICWRGRRTPPDAC